MNVKEMTNEELAVYFFNAAEGGTTLFKRCLREAATRLRDLKPCNKNFKCDSLEELLTAEKRKNAELRRQLKTAGDALDDLLSVACSDCVSHYGDDGSICKDCPTKQRARDILATIRKEKKNGHRSKLNPGEKDFRLTCKTVEETVLALRQVAKNHPRGGKWERFYLDEADKLERMNNEFKKKGTSK